MTQWFNYYVSGERPTCPQWMQRWQYQTLSLLLSGAAVACSLSPEFSWIIIVAPKAYAVTTIIKNQTWQWGMSNTRVTFPDAIDCRGTVLCYPRIYRIPATFRTPKTDGSPAILKTPLNLHELDAVSTSPKRWSSRCLVTGVASIVPTTN